MTDQCLITFTEDDGLKDVVIELITDQQEAVTLELGQKFILTTKRIVTSHNDRYHKIALTLRICPK